MDSFFGFGISVPVSEIVTVIELSENLKQKSFFDGNFWAGESLPL